MRRWVSSWRLPKAASLAILALGLLMEIGCAHRPGHHPFGISWDNGAAPTNNRTQPPTSTGLIPKLLRQDKDDWSEDPFLARNGEPSSGHDKTGLPARSNAPAAIQTGYDRPGLAEEEASGRLLKVVEHQKPVSEISSSESVRRGTGTSPDPEPEAGASQLDRLKYALSRDAKTQLPQQPQSAVSEVARQRVEALMKNARRQMQLGEYASALRWAMAAEQLAARSDLFFGPDEDPPADLVRSLQDRLKVPPQTLPAPIQAMTEQALPRPTRSGQTSEPPEFSIIVPEIVPRISPEPREDSSSGLANISSSQPHSTRAMQEAVIAPETLTPKDEFEERTPVTTLITPSQRHARSLKIDARKVSANQGAVVSVEGQLNPPVESRMPDLPLAPPVVEDIAELPPLGVVMAEPTATTPPPPLPPPDRIEPTAPAPPPFLYADNDLPAPKPKRNVHWEEADSLETSNAWPWWVFPAMGGLGLVLLGALLVKRKRA